MANINDAILQATGGPTVNEGLATHYSKTTTENLQDAEYRWLIEAGATPAQINDMWFEVLRDAGYTGALPDMLLDFWGDGGQVCAEYTLTVGNAAAAYGFHHTPVIGAIDPTTIEGETIIAFYVNSNLFGSIYLEMAGSAQIPYVDEITISYGDDTTTLSWNVPNNYYYSDGGLEAQAIHNAIIAANGGDIDLCMKAKVVIPIAPPIFSGVFDPPDGEVGVVYTPYDCSQFFTTGGTPTSYSLSGTLPSSGLDFDTNTGIISGTPVNDGTWTNLAVRADNADGFDSSNIADIAIAPAQELPSYILNLDGTNYAALSEPFIATGASSVTFSMSTTGGVLQDLTDGYSITALDVFDTPVEVTDILVDGLSVGLAGPAPVDGLSHAVKFIASSMSVKNNVGANNANGNKFQGIIYDALFDDEVIPANSISWTLDSGPPVYVNDDPAQGTISDGTVYEESEEHGTLPDIMRPDEWLNTDANKVATGKTVTFNGSQGTWSSVVANNGDTYSGLHILNAIITVTQGSVFISCSPSGQGYSYSADDVINISQVADINSIIVEDNGDDGARFIGSVEFIQVLSVPKGLIYNNVAPPDWLPTITTPEYLFATFTATATTPADSLWRYDSTDSYAVAKVLDDEYIYTQSSTNAPIPLVDGDEINWYVKDADSLTLFYCYTNQLTGSIPDLSSNTALAYFRCNTNQLTGSIPDLSSNTVLIYFRCNLNQLTGSIPNLSSNTSLTQFYCDSNQLTGNIPDLSSNTALAKFYCDSNQLTGSIPDLSSNTALTHFYCYSNQLTGFSGGWPNKAFEFDASDNALTESAVNQILIDADTYGIPVGTTINLTGGTNSGPSGLGITAKNNLIANGATVTTNADVIAGDWIDESANNWVDESANNWTET